MAAGGSHLHDTIFPLIGHRAAGNKKMRAQRWDPHGYTANPFSQLEPTGAITRSKFANSEGALRPWALLSQDAGQAAHGL